MRVYNFAAGPATLPEPVLKQAQEELLDWNNSGMSVVEISHRSKAFVEVIDDAKASLSELLSLPNNYEILFLMAPARAQFAMIPLNLLNGKTTADYINTGIWSKLASQEGKKYCEVNIAADGEDTNFTTIPPQSEWQLNPEAAYLHYTSNETVNGVEFQSIPEAGDVPLITDMTSCFLSEPIDIKKFALIYSGTQKNIAPAGMTIVIIRKDLLGNATPQTPTVFDYQVMAENNSLYYTPCSFSCYMAGLMFKWIKAQGGLSAMAEINKRKAKKLYDYIDNSSLYSNPIDLNYRSKMNVPFTLPSKDLDAKFLEESTKSV